MYIIINGKEVATYKKELSYENIVAMSGMDYREDYSLAWSVKNDSGTLTPGQEIIINQRIVFNVALTDNT